jgi:hypothetical protein
LNNQVLTSCTGEGNEGAQSGDDQEERLLIKGRNYKVTRAEEY